MLINTLLIVHQMHVMLRTAVLWLRFNIWREIELSFGFINVPCLRGRAVFLEQAWCGKFDIMAHIVKRLVIWLITMNFELIEFCFVQCINVNQCGILVILGKYIWVVALAEWVLWLDMGSYIVMHSMLVIRVVFQIEPLPI